MKLWTIAEDWMKKEKIDEQPPMLDPETADLVSTFLSHLTLGLEELSDPVNDGLWVNAMKLAWTEYYV